MRTMASAGRAVVFSGHRRRDRPRAPALRPGSVRPDDGPGRTVDPARLDRRRADAATGAALALRPPRAHGRAPSPRRPSAPRAVGGARAHDHAPPARRPGAATVLLLAAAAPAGSSSGSARARSPALPRATESARGLAALSERLRRRRADADGDRRRRGRARRGARRRRPRRRRRDSRTGCSTIRRSTSSRAAAGNRTSRPAAATRASSSSAATSTAHRHRALLVDAHARRISFRPRASRSGRRSLVGGAAPKGVDFLARTYAFFPWLVAAGARR